MVIDNIYKFKNPVEIKSDDLIQLESIITKYYPSVKYTAELKDGSNVIFDNLDELLKFKNERERKILVLKVLAGRFDFSREIEIKFESGISSYKAFSYSIKVEYKFHDSEKEIIFLNEIKSFCNHIKKDPVFSFFSKLWAPTILIALGAIFFTIEFIFKAITSNAADTHINETFDIPVSMIIGIITMMILVFLDKFWRYMFPSIVILLGEEVKNDIFRNKLRSVIFIVILLGIVVSLIGSFVFSAIQ